jgi:hypothetical protein
MQRILQRLDDDKKRHSRRKLNRCISDSESSSSSVHSKDGSMKKITQAAITLYSCRAILTT